MQSNYGKLVGISCLSVCLIACSPIDSTKPFDKQQAANLIRGIYKPHSTKQQISVALPASQSWERTDLSYGTVGSPVIFLPTGQTALHWQEKIATDIRAYQFIPTANMDSLFNSQLVKEQQDCQIVNATNLAKTEDSLIYQINAENCKDHASILQIGKIFAGVDGIYLVYYSADSQVVSSKQIALMRTVIADAELNRQEPKIR